MKTALAFAAALLAAAAVPPATAQAPALKLGEYACYGSGSRVLAGMGFKVQPGNRYVDLDGKEKGSYTIQGDRIAFKGGHMQDIAGHGLNAKGQFRAGKMAVCEPW